MAEGIGVSPEQFGSLFKDFMERSMQSAPRTEPYFLGVLRSHFEQDPRRLATVGEAMPVTDHPNLHRALERYVAAPGREANLGGVAGMQEYRSAPSRRS